MQSSSAFLPSVLAIGTDGTLRKTRHLVMKYFGFLAQSTNSFGYEDLSISHFQLVVICRTVPASEAHAHREIAWINHARASCPTVPQNVTTCLQSASRRPRVYLCGRRRESFAYGEDKLCPQSPFNGFKMGRGTRLLPSLNIRLLSVTTLRQKKPNQIGVGGGRRPRPIMSKLLSEG
jgi:hypothetical protein